MQQTIRLKVEVPLYLLTTYSTDDRQRQTDLLYDE